MRVEVSGKQFSFPPQCACCSASADATFTVSVSKSSGKEVVKTKTNTWDFPYCNRCLGHIRAAKNASSMSTLVGVGSVLFAGFLYFSVASWLGFIVAVGGIAGAIAVHSNLMTQAKAMCIPQCACLLESVAFLDWDGTRQVFEIASPDYALAFMVANERKLVNVSSAARQLLEAGGHGHKANKPQAPRRYST